MIDRQQNTDRLTERNIEGKQTDKSIDIQIGI